MKLNDYVVAIYVDHDKKEFSITARSESRSPHWKKNGNNYTTDSCRIHTIIFASLNEDVARFEKTKLRESFLSNCPSKGYTEVTVGETK